jgi:hypothetical protein
MEGGDAPHHPPAAVFLHDLQHLVSPCTLADHVLREEIDPVATGFPGDESYLLAVGREDHRRFLQ